MIGKMHENRTQVKADQSIKTGFNFTSQQFSDKWRNLLHKIK